jgi:hypothetical protein
MKAPCTFAQKDPTEAERRWIEKANKLGQICCPLPPNGLVKANFHRTMKRMVASGLVIPNPYGEYELTVHGRTFLPPRKD